MKALTEETALSILFANTKRKKRTIDLVTMAIVCEFLVGLYGSQTALAKRVDLSPEMIREFLLASRLPSKVRKLIKERKIDSIDIVREIASLGDPNRQIEAANLLTHTLSKDVRDIKRLAKYRSISIEDAKKNVAGEKPAGLHIFVMDFDDEMHRRIMEKARILKTTPADLVRRIVTDWIEQSSVKLRR